MDLSYCDILHNILKHLVVQDIFGSCIIVNKYFYHVVMNNYFLMEICALFSINLENEMKKMTLYEKLRHVYLINHFNNVSIKHHEKLLYNEMYSATNFIHVDNSVWFLPDLSINDYNINCRFSKEILYSIFELRNLKKIILDYCEITYIPNEINNLINLEIATFNYNKITHIPVLSNLPNLRVILLNYNYIKYIPDHISLLTNIQILSFNNNCIEQIPFALTNLLKLKKLSFSQNLIRDILEEISQLTNLCCLVTI
jgi:hypothetical protein